MLDGKSTSVSRTCYLLSSTATHFILLHFPHSGNFDRMKFFVVLALCAASAAANNYGAPAIRVESSSYSAPQIRTESSYGSSYGSQQLRSEIPITRFSHEIRGSQSDSVSFETGNGISQSDNTQVVQGRGSSYDDGYGNMVQSNAAVHKNGAYSYTAPEGQHISTTWTADENGFRAEGAHLPRSVEMPADHAEAHRLALSRSSSYGGSYEAPMRSSYDAPAPAIRVQSYDAPAPAVRVQSYSAPQIRSSY